MSDFPEVTTPCCAENCLVEGTSGKWSPAKITSPTGGPTAVADSKVATASCVPVVVDNQSVVDGGPDGALPSARGECEPCCSNGIELAQAVGNGTVVEHPETTAAEGLEVLNSNASGAATLKMSRGEHRTRVSVAGAFTLLVAAYLQTQIPP